MRVIYNEQMADLAGLLGEMAGVAGTLMEQATQALLEADLPLAEQVIGEGDRIAEMNTLAEEKAFALLALQAPVAGDLRQVVSAIQIVGDVNRMGVLALHVAKVARRRHPNHALPESVNGYFAEMGRIAVNMGAAAKEVLESRDPHRAAQLNVDDEAMDDLHKHLFTLLMDREWKDGVAAAVDVTLLGRYYERFADHAVEIGRRVVFLVTGVLPPDTDPATE
ncbi:phosphate signaling complex protein PhoU [Nocardia stercoris]|uniref:Phosphate-specific transport system accessory protein PhoU n=1 Tax=Nocardia stercoris TaxID=2483361 RepID=A0A3M2L5B4_9NOCA|nr:phosphate signaling complex protein PhoU [Nocardia stercoris]RMI29728.1 phosphate transport system regulatory protein PhoU [Nocardia stercoris]